FSGFSRAAFSAEGALIRLFQIQVDFQRPPGIANEGFLDDITFTAQAHIFSSILLLKRTVLR
ncbi:MAG: hypothetical protein AAB037_06445, partial [Chloroflexota bacterium]